MKQKKFIIYIIIAILLFSCNLGIKNPNQFTIQLGTESSNARGICDGNEVVQLNDDNNLMDIVVKITASDGKIKTYTKSDNTLTVNSDSITITNTEFSNDFSIELQIISKVARYIGKKNNVVLDNPSTQTVIIPITEVRPHILLYGTTDSTGGSGSSGFKCIYGLPDIKDREKLYNHQFDPDNTTSTIDKNNTLKCLTLDKYGRICLLTDNNRIKIIHNSTAITSEDNDIEYFTVDTASNTIYAVTKGKKIVKYSIWWNNITGSTDVFTSLTSTENIITTSKDYIALAEKNSGNNWTLSIHSKNNFSAKKETTITTGDITDIKIIDDKIYVLMSKNKMSIYKISELVFDKKITIFHKPVKFLGIQNNCLYIADKKKDANRICEYDLSTGSHNFIEIKNAFSAYESKMNFKE